MPHPSRTPSSERRSLRLNDVAHMGAAELQPLLQDSFRNLVTAAIADATGHLPRSSRKLLHGPHFRDDLVDALRWAEGEMQVASERMTWIGDPRAERTGHQLQQIRTALAQARAEEADRRRAEHRASAGHQVDTDPAATARIWLRSAFPDRFEQLLAQEYATAQLEPRTERPGPADVFDAIEWGASEGYLFATMTPAVHDLLAKSPLAFRNTVAADAREQDERNVELRHPLLLRRWRTALDELAEMTAPLAGAASPTLLGPLTTDLDAMPRQAAFAVLNARRFLVASTSAPPRTPASPASTPRPSPSANRTSPNTPPTAAPSTRPCTGSPTSTPPRTTTSATGYGPSRPGPASWTHPS
ncbi:MULTISPECIES: hypothetical protein [unclassified Streptomyces]|uniref:hypothetical protein n=1 Tax=unclassified Streptomyces TaxID=2593676 RepID=UPI000823BDA0|nr:MULTISPECIES: hypothetical protein [unclassified Streptomyces]MYT96581.1 hypothetical protein [Streptomyces sp. SID8350]SCK53987.1 hypothetical protein YUWDRAFT_04786 [Streptomyces sp. AmelKG-D3]